MTASLNAYPDMDLFTVRAVSESPQLASSEPKDVTYEPVTARGVPSLWVKPLDAPSDRAIIFFHGGAFVTGSINSHRKLAGHLAKAAATKVLVIDYRLAPEHQFPAQLDDSLAAIEWLYDQGIEPSKLATAGDSAGGNLVTATCLKLGDEGQGRMPAAIIAFSPWYNMEHKEESIDAYAGTDTLVNGAIVAKMAAAFLGEQRRDQPLANLLYADPTALPPMYLNCGSWEALQDDTLLFAEMAKKAGVEVRVEITSEMQHVHVFMAGRASEADDVLQNVGKWVWSELA